MNGGIGHGCRRKTAQDGLRPRFPAGNDGNGLGKSFAQGLHGLQAVCTRNNDQLCDLGRRCQRFDRPAQDGYAVQRCQELVDALHTLRAAGCDDNGRAADISPAHSAITVFLNSAPLTIKFLKRSKAALAGDSSTISPGFACCAAA